jgi:hypothetical protein
MDMHDTLGSDMDRFIKECSRLFHNKQSKGYLSLFFCIQFFRQCVNIVFQCVLVFTIKKKIVLASDACSRPPISIRFHDLHANEISVATLTLGSRPKQGLAKVRAKNEPGSHISCSQECKRV